MKKVKIIFLLFISLVYTQTAYDALRPFYGYDDSQTLTSSIGSATVASGNAIPGYTTNPANIGLYRFGLLQTNFVQNKFVSGDSQTSNSNIGTINWTHPLVVYKGSLAFGFSANKDRDFLSSVNVNGTEYSEGGEIRSKSFLVSVEFAQNTFLGGELKYYSGENDLLIMETDSTFYFSPEYSGWGLVVGLLQRVNDKLNIGFSVELPTCLLVKDRYAEWDNDNVANEYSDIWNYDVKRPMIIHAGTSFIFKNLNMFYEMKYTDWSSIEFSSDEYYYGDIIDINNEIESELNSTTSHHLGMAYRFNKLPFNLYCGYQYLPIPYSGVYESDIQNSYSLGLSYLISNNLSLQSTYKLYSWTYGTQDESYSQMSIGLSIHY